MADKEQALPTWVIVGIAGVVIAALFVWVLARMAALGDREDR